MPFVTTIIARLLALQDWYLGLLVDVQVINTSSSCYTAFQIDANVSGCGQNVIAAAYWGWVPIMENLLSLTQNIVMALLYTGPVSGWTPYIPPTPPIP
jgi:hypothetical protein